MELKKSDVASNNDNIITLDNYLNEIIEKEIIQEKDINYDIVINGVLIDGKLCGKCYITVNNKYIYLLEEDLDPEKNVKLGNLNIEYQGKAELMSPIITSMEFKNTTTNSTTVSLKSQFADNATYTYYIKLKTEDDSKYVKKVSNKELEYTFTGLTQNAIYDVKVVVERKGLSSQRIESVLIKELLELKLGSVTFGTENWDKDTHKASIEISTNTGYQIQYQVDNINGEWTSNSTVTNLNHEQPIYVRLSDGTNTTNYVSYTVSSHVWDSGVITKQPNCTQTGEKVLTCTLCGETKQETVVALGHNTEGGQGSVITPATCSTIGLAYCKCSRCGADNTTTSQRITLPINLSNHSNMQSKTGDKTIHFVAVFDTDPSFPAKCFYCGRTKIAYHFYIRNVQTAINLPENNNILLTTLQAGTAPTVAGYYPCSYCSYTWVEFASGDLTYLRSGTTPTKVVGEEWTQGKHPTTELGEKYAGTAVNSWNLYDHYATYYYTYNYCNGCGAYEYTGGHY